MRAYDFSLRSKSYFEFINENKLEFKNLDVEIISYFDNEQDALDFEKQLINKYKEVYRLANRAGTKKNTAKPTKVEKEKLYEDKALLKLEENAGVIMDKKEYKNLREYFRVECGAKRKNNCKAYGHELFNDYIGRFDFKVIKFKDKKINNTRKTLYKIIKLQEEKFLLEKCV